ncbi:phytase [Hyphococcus luteus]|uniref:3-phytase n=1 Tax=Hyphococcus luteus TaxID=2058213 RepID=A0A2S7JZN8_9PROT|nr:phytase [Marinicaulis flavus]PQA85702.1 3-phytase [Marinicaulis flavus]
MRLKFSAAALLPLAAGCISAGPSAPSVHAAGETAPVNSAGDAADDPAVWVNVGDTAESLILGTDKRAGLYVYDLKGAVVQFLPAGKLNNVDLRQNVSLDGWTGDIAAASNRTDNTVTLFTIEEDGAVAESGAFPSLLDEPYGLCLGAQGGDVFAFVAYKTGDLIAYRLAGPGGGAEAARMKLESQLEGCVFDDEAGVLYIGEEETGVWKAAFDGGGFSALSFIDEVGGASGVAADVEGLALYKTGPGTGYLIASSQGNNSYAVYTREGDNAFVTRFAVTPGETIDGSEETDGVEAVSADLGPDFPEGVFIAQDGFNDPKGSAQNFKIVDWREIGTLIETAESGLEAGAAN